MRYVNILKHEVRKFMKLFHLIWLFLLSGCATSKVSDFMQPDASYRIEAESSRSTYVEGRIISLEMAERRAEALCPKGYVLQAGFYLYSFANDFVLIVKCK